MKCGEDASGHRRAAFGGLSTCGSVWACPVCSAKITAERAGELTQLVEWNAARGGAVALLTLTMRHHKGMRLLEARRMLTKAWRHVTSSRGWKHAKQAAGMDGYVRAIEATYGEHGWHLHIHALLIFDGPVSADMVTALEAEVWARWSTGLRREGGSALPSVGVDLRVGDSALETLGQYINKIAYEAVGGRWKKGRGGGRTPFELLAAVVRSRSQRDGGAERFGTLSGVRVAADVDGESRQWEGDVDVVELVGDELSLWHEWESDSKGMRQLVWSRGLKARAGVVDRTDEEIAEEEAAGDTVAVLPARTWREVRRVADGVLSLLEAHGPGALYAFLDSNGLPFDQSDPVIP